MDKEYIDDKLKSIFVGTLIVFLATFAISYQEADTVDFLAHTEWALKLNRYIFDYMIQYISYPLWHLVVKIIYKVFCFNIVTSVAGATAIFNCIAFWSIVYSWDFLSNKPTNFNTKVFWAIFILLMGPLYAPGFNNRYYLGQGTGNIWHSPTHIAVKGFAVLCFVWIVRLVNQEVEHRKWEYFLLSVLLFLSALAKPSFLQAMIPGFCLYFIYELLCNLKDGGAWKCRACAIHFGRIAVMFIPSIFLLGSQFVLNFMVDTSIHHAEGIGVSYGAVLSEWSDNLFVSLLLALAFPLFVLLIDAKHLFKDTSVKLAVCYGLCGWLEAAFLFENGIRKKHGNWTWGWNISLFVIWMLFIIKYIDIIRDATVSSKKRMVCLCLGMPILFFHVIFGIGYIVLILRGVIVS